MTGVGQWLEDLGLGRYAEAFAASDIDFDILTDLTEADLAQLGVSLGDRKRLLRGIAVLRAGGAVPGDRPSALPTAAEPLRPGHAAERRQLTVMFCDMVGSTALAARLDPEDLHEVMRRYQESCAEVVARYEGHVGNYVGDGILAYFGYPKAHEDDALRAIRAGLDIVDAIRRLAGELDDYGVESRPGRHQHRPRRGRRHRHRRVPGRDGGRGRDPERRGAPAGNGPAGDRGGRRAHPAAGRRSVRASRSRDRT